ncbi:MAG: hypothetical protein GY730_05645 [bacterium]|nr:hypothetical protein [bacterium]
MKNKIFFPGIISGACISIAGLIIGTAFNTVFPSVAAEYKNIEIFRDMKDPLMAVFWLYPFILGIALSWVWNIVKPVLKGSEKQNITSFALAYFIIAQLPGMLITYSSFQLSALIVSSWALNGLVNGFIVAFFSSKFNK